MTGRRQPSREALRAILARRSLADFVRFSWSVLEPTTPLVWNWHMQATADHVQALIEGRLSKNNLVVNIPPGSAKSRIVSVCTTPWRWLEHPEWRAIYSSANPGIVLRDSIYARNIIESDWYQLTFRPRWRFAPDQNAKGLFRNTEQGFRMAKSANAKITGDRADFLGMDDLLDAAEAESRASREAVITWLDQAFLGRVNNMANSKRCMIGQRLHEGDPCGHVLASGDWELLSIAQEYEVPRHAETKEPLPVAVSSIGWRDPRTADGELMDPRRFPATALEAEKRRLGSRGYSAQHQQRPAPAEGTLLKRSWFQWYKMPAGTPAEIVKALGITRIIQGWDTAQTEKTSADNTAGITFGEAPSRYYVLDRWMDKVESPAAKGAIVSQQAKWGAHAVVVEGGSSASGKAIVQSIRQGSTLPVIEMPVKTDKVAGLNQVAPTVEAKVVYLPEDQPWAADLLESLIRFPVGVHDDDVDAFRIGLGYAVFGGSAFGMLEWIKQQQEKAPAA